MAIISYKELIVWQKAMDLVSEIYILTEKFPPEEKFGLISQIRRCAVSVPSNIAEGRARGYRKEFRQFMLNAFGSGAELETQLLIAKRLPKMSQLDYEKADLLLDQVMKMLNTIISKLKFES